MKNKLLHLQIDDLLVAEIHEILSPHECIVSLEGDLIRARNESLIQLQPYQKVKVRVRQLSPLALQIVNDREARGGILRLNISI